VAGIVVMVTTSGRDFVGQRCAVKGLVAMESRQEAGYSLEQRPEDGTRRLLRIHNLETIGVAATREFC
jgi:hypothetical protein